MQRSLLWSLVFLFFIIYILKINHFNRQPFPSDYYVKRAEYPSSRTETTDSLQAECFFFFFGNYQSMCLVPLLCSLLDVNLVARIIQLGSFVPDQEKQGMHVHQFFNGISNWNVSNRDFRFSQTKIVSSHLIPFTIRAIFLCICLFLIL